MYFFSFLTISSMAADVAHSLIVYLWLEMEIIARHLDPVPTYSCFRNDDIEGDSGTVYFFKVQTA